MFKYGLVPLGASLFLSVSAAQSTTIAACCTQSHVWVAADSHTEHTEYGTKGSPGKMEKIVALDGCTLFAAAGIISGYFQDQHFDTYRDATIACKTYKSIGDRSMSLGNTIKPQLEKTLAFIKRRDPKYYSSLWPGKTTPVVLETVFATYNGIAKLHVIDFVLDQRSGTITPKHLDNYPIGQIALLGENDAAFSYANSRPTAYTQSTEIQQLEQLVAEEIRAMPNAVRGPIKILGVGKSGIVDRNDRPIDRALNHV